MPDKIKLHVSHQLRQEQHLTPQMLQSMEVLQMNSQELLEYVNRAADENPMLEREEAAILRSEYEQLRSRIGWLDSRIPTASEPLERGGMDRELESLGAFLCDQLDRMGLSKPLLALCKYLARLVDEDGYLLPEDLESLREMEIPAEMIAEPGAAAAAPRRGGRNGAGHCERISAAAGPQAVRRHRPGAGSQ